MFPLQLVWCIEKILSIKVLLFILSSNWGINLFERKWEQNHQKDNYKKTLQNKPSFIEAK
jgi:hypothetical protein